MESVLREYIVGSITKADFKKKLKQIICDYEYWQLTEGIQFIEGENDISFVCDDETNDIIEVTFKKEIEIVPNEEIVIEFKGTCAYEISQVYIWFIEKWH